jgi:ATP-dependent Clp protease ATP-binding subunit ClpX
VGKKALGFKAIAEKDHGEPGAAYTAQRDAELLRRTEPQDLIKFGLIPEFVGRLPVLGVLDELDEAALIEILTKPRNAILKQYQRLFEYESVKVAFSEEAVKAIAQEALQRKVGARGLRMILEELMLDLMYHLPSNKKIKELEITADMVKNRDMSLMLLDKAG